MKTTHDKISHSDPPFETIEAVRSQLVNAVLFVFAATGLLAVLASLLRILTMGWRDIMFAHIGFYLLVLATTILHRRQGTGSRVQTDRS